MNTRVRLRDHLLHFRPRAMVRRLQSLHEAGQIDEVPNLWQLTLGVGYMWHRAVFRPETVGLSTNPVRDTRRARLFQYRPLRGPFVLGRRVNPLDHTGLGSSTAHVIRHILGAHHEADDFAYDLSLIAHEPGALQALRDEARAIVAGSHPQAAFLRDLCVYQGYHETVVAVVDGWLARGGADVAGRTHDHADKTLRAYLTWCARQPRTLRETVRVAARQGLDFSPTVPPAPVWEAR